MVKPKTVERGTCKPGSVRLVCQPWRSFISTKTKVFIGGPMASCTLPDGQPERTTPCGLEKPLPSVWACSGGGLPCPCGHPQRLWALTPPFTLACASRSWPSAVYSLWHFPDAYAWSPLATLLPCGARTFLDSTANCATANARFPYLPRRTYLGNRSISSYFLAGQLPDVNIRILLWKHRNH